MKEGWLSSYPLITLLLVIFASVLSLVLLAYLGYLGWRSWKRLDELELKDRFSARNDFIKTTAQILGGAFFLLTIYFTYQNLAVSQKNLAATQDRNLTDVFTKAIEQLGSDKIEVRLGGISALGRIGRQSKDDRMPIIEVLTAYVRMHAPVPRVPDETAAAEKPTKTLKTAIGQQREKAVVKKRPEADVQAVLRVIAHLALVEKTKFSESWIGSDLSETDLRGADLEGAPLGPANLTRARLEGANLFAADLDGANLDGARLDGANLAHAKLQRADNLDAEQLRRAQNWVLAFLPWRIQEKLDLPRDHNQKLEKNNLSFYNFAGWDLRDANFMGMNLEGVNFRGANLEKASFGSANLEKAILEKANLKGADLRYVHTLTREQLAGAITDETTKLPEDWKGPQAEKPEAK